MDFELTEKQTAMKKEISGLCASGIAGAAADVDLNEQFPRDNWKKLAKRGFFGLLVPEQYGGGGGDLISGLAATEEVAAACGSTAMAACFSQWCAAKAIELYAAGAVKEKFLPKLASGDIVGAFAATEKACGSDLGAVETSAEKVDGGYVLNGEKTYVTNAPVAGLIVVIAKTGGALSLFLVPAHAEGVRIGEPLKTMGLRGAVAAPVILKNVQVTGEYILGEEGSGAATAADIYDYARLGVSAVALGISRAAFVLAKEFAEQRVAFGKPVGVYQDIAFRVADMHVEMDLARQLLYQGAWKKHGGMECSSMIAGAKLQATEVAVRNTSRAMTILAGRGALRGCPAERLYRDAKLTETAAGTNDMMCRIVSDDLLKD